MRQDAFSTLKALPAVFDLRDMEVLLGVRRDYARLAVHRWAERGMVAHLGPRAAVYFNLVVDPDGKSSRIKEAVDKLLSRPVVAVGAAALHYHGWTTQRPYLTELAVPVSGRERTIPKMNRIIAVKRLRGWFQAVLPRSEIGVDGFLIAPPEFALVDTIMEKGEGGLWQPDPSDIDLPADVDAAAAAHRIEEAADILKADISQVRAFIAEIDGFDEAFPSP